MHGVRARTPLNSGCFRLNFYGLTSLSGHKVGMLSPKKDQLKPLGRFNSKLYTKSNYIGVPARTPCTFWDNCQFCQNCVFCVNKLWIKWKWTLYDQYTMKGHELNLYCIKKLPAYELVRRALLSRAILTCIPPPPFMANTILNFHFDYLITSLSKSLSEKMVSC